MDSIADSGPPRNFNPRAPYGARRRRWSGSSSIKTDFNPRAPYGARPADGDSPKQGTKISIHAPHTGRDLHLLIVIYQTGGFQSTRPIRGATAERDTRPTTTRISIHAPHTGRDCVLWLGCGFYSISIHAPHTGRDVNVAFIIVCSQVISIHAPHTGRDTIKRLSCLRILKFQSTRPIRGATCFC